jgi:hypothetical protein
MIVRARIAAMAATLGCTVAALSATTGPASAASVLRPATALTIGSGSYCNAIGSSRFVCEVSVLGGVPPYDVTFNGHSTGSSEYGGASWGGTCVGNQVVYVAVVVQDSAASEVSTTLSTTCIAGIVPQ